jgi:hypothetical protein
VNVFYFYYANGGIVKRSGLSMAMLMALIGGGLAGCSHNCYDRGEGCFSSSGSGGGTVATLSGKVVDGYVSGGAIFKANADGSCSTTQVGTTDATGNFTITGDAPNGICASGGIDTSTGTALVGTLKTPAGATMITPLTTLVAASGLSVSAFCTLMGIDPATDLLNIDPKSPSAPAGLEQMGAAVQSMMASMAATMANGGDPTAAFAAVVNAVVSAVTSGSVNLSQVAASGDFSVLATAVANDPGVAAAAAPGVDLAAAAADAAAAGSSSSSDNAPPPASYTMLAGVSANGGTAGTVNSSDTTKPDSLLTLTSAAGFHNVTLSLATATGDALLGATTTTTINVAPTTGTQALTVAIPTDWAESPSTNGVLTPSIHSGSPLTVVATKTNGTVYTATLQSTTALSTSSGSITLNLDQLFTDLAGASSNFDVLVGYNTGSGTTAGKKYIVTTTIPGLKLKTLTSTTGAPVATHSYTTEVDFN